MNLILDIHVIQSYPVSNLNRDDSGSPKDCIIGGSRRARVSSQCVKRAMRLHPSFSARVERAGGDTGIRTRFLLGVLTSALTEKGLTNEDAEKAANSGIRALGLAFDKKNPERTEYLLYLGQREIADLVNLLIDEAKRTAIVEAVEKAVAKAEKKSSKKPSDDTESDSGKVKIELEKSLKDELSGIIGSARKDGNGYAADIALFGRMMADVKDMNVDGASQVAHAISTHRVETVLDYYTAVDDRNTEDAGAGMVGIQEYNSACYYRYANAASAALLESLAGDKAMAIAALVGFAEAAALAIPSGKQRSTATATRPAYIRYVLRKDSAPLSYAGAFSSDVRPSLTGEPSIESLSIERLKEHADRLDRIYGSGDVLESLEICLEDDQGPSLAEALSRLEERLKRELGA